MTGRRTVLIAIPGLLAADVLSGVDTGGLPAMRGLIEGGTSGAIAGGGASMVANAWTVATGTPAHGVFAPFVPMPGQAGLYPVARDAGLRRPAWEVAADDGIGACSVAWPGTGYASNTAALVVGDGIHAAFGTCRGAWPLLPGICNLPQHGAALRDLRVHPGEITAELVDFLAGRGADARVGGLVRQAIAASATVQAVLTHTLAAAEVRLVCGYFDLLDRVRRLPEPDPRRRARLLASSMRFIDHMLAALLKASGADTVTCLVAPPAAVGDTVAEGLVALSGPGIRADALLNGARLVDVAPTVLASVNAAVPGDLPGRVLDAWVTRPEPAVGPVVPGAMLDRSGWAWSEVCRLGLTPPRPFGAFRLGIEGLQDRVGGE